MRLYYFFVEDGKKGVRTYITALEDRVSKLEGKECTERGGQDMADRQRPSG